MKHKFLTLFSMLTLIAMAPLAAQTTGASEEDQRTNPNARSSVSDSQLTIMGTVTSWNQDEIILDTETGTQHIKLLPQTQKPVQIEQGMKVSVDFTRTSQGVMLAQKIRPEGTMTEPTAATTVEAPAYRADADTDVDMDMDMDVDVDVDVDVDENDVDVDVDTSYESSDRQTLPRTASELPWLLGLGLTAAVGAAGFRASR